MQGVIDAPMRARLTSIGGYDRCVTEFVRVGTLRLPERVFLRLCPELASGGATPVGTPVHVQLLGSDPRALASNAVRAVAMGAPGIDLNFGCPAKTVNRSEGGSILLREPARIALIVRAVRDAVRPEVPVSAKIRLGYDNAALLPEITELIRAAGADELAIHARTKFDGYRPPAWWSAVREVVQDGDTRTTINGEIWSVRDSLVARSRSGCRHVMLGRGALAVPDLAIRIRSGDPDSRPMCWAEVAPLVEAQYLESDRASPRHVGNRTKQWLVYLGRTYVGAQTLFASVRGLHDRSGMEAAFKAHRHALDSDSAQVADLSAGVAIARGARPGPAFDVAMTG